MASRYAQIIRRLRLRHLELLQVLDESPTLSHAAERLNLSQSAVSKMLGEIEEELGAVLFHRSKRGVSATAEGHVAIRGARLVLNDLAALSERVEIARQGASDLLRIGTLSTAAVLAYGLTTFHRKYPGMRSRLVEGIVGDLVKLLFAGEIDCIVGVLPIDKLSQTEIDELKFDVIAEDHLCVMAAPGHPLMRKRRLSWQQLQDERWVLPHQDTLIRSTFIAAFLKESLHPPGPEIESTSPVTMRWLVRADPQRLGLMRWQQARDEVAQGYLSMLPLASNPALPPISLISRKKVGRHNDMLEDFKRALIEEGCALDSAGTRARSSRKR